MKLNMTGALALVGGFAVAVGAALWFFLLSPEGGLSAEEMRLERYNGFLTMKNAEVGKDVVTGARLVSGDNLATFVESNAYISLDRAKIVVMDAETEIDLLQGDKTLGIDIKQGSVFFNVTEPLAEDEILEFRSNNVVTGVRGTSGIISYFPEEGVTQISVLTGTVVGTTVTEEKSVTAGEFGVITTLEDGTVDFQIYRIEDDVLPWYYQDVFVDEFQGDLSNEVLSLALSDLVRVSNQPADPMAYVTIDSGYSVRNSAIQEGRDMSYHIYEIANTSSELIDAYGINYYDDTYFEVVAIEGKHYYDTVRVTCTGSGAIPYPTLDDLLSEGDYTQNGKMDLNLYTGAYGARAYSYPVILFATEDGYVVSEALQGEFEQNPDGSFYFYSRGSASGLEFYNAALVDDTLVKLDSFAYDVDMWDGTETFEAVIYENGVEAQRYESSPAEMSWQEFLERYEVTHN